MKHKEFSTSRYDSSLIDLSAEIRLIKPVDINHIEFFDT